MAGDTPGGIDVRVAKWWFQPTLWPTLATIAVLALLLWLGFWQLDRAAQKRQLADEFTARMRDAPLAVTADADHRGFDPDSWRYRRVEVRGRYLGARQFLLDNRTHRGTAGYHVLTALELTPGADSAVMVNRGWVAVGPRRDRLPALAVPPGQVKVSGIVGIPPRESFLLGASGYEQRTWPRVVQVADLTEMQAAFGTRLLPFVVLLEAEGPHGYVREWTPYLGFGPDRHRAYAFQWFSLAGALVIIYLVVNSRRSD